MTTLHFECRGKWYKVKPDGDLIQEENHYNNWDGNWIFLGVSFHHWRRGIDMTLKEIFENPVKAIGGLVWDVDHGTIRIWGGEYCGKLPRITHCYID